MDGLIIILLVLCNDTQVDGYLSKRETFKFRDSIMKRRNFTMNHLTDDLVGIPSSFPRVVSVKNRKDIGIQCTKTSLWGGNSEKNQRMGIS